MTDVFISYAREDRRFVQRLHDALANEGRQSWVDWEGILVSGGTAQGVSALAADVSAAVGGIRAIGYLPSSLPEDVTEDDRYDELLRTGGERFSPLEPLTYWRDLLDDGMFARDVGVVAIGGGRLTRMAQMPLVKISAASQSG